MTNAEHELFGKAKDSEEDILAKVVKIKESKKQMVTITHYQNEDHELFVRSSSNVELYENMPLNHGYTTIVKVLVGRDEAFYLRDEKGEYPYQSILWIKDSVRDSVMFEVMTYSLDQVTMDELITIAEKVNE
ncbi:hypothetical protein Q75_16870 [Bacillus coahuilensis p1.1.43]|uniref:DUF4367 domain-containing protein n=1 Tax=Bacillus coahuilensis p1.1.43 TaxID=1150625 RepID=A0A147K3X1_9BACI|nr:hypothetical protein [Bacillus coahuilensis]KUP03989.1 hypothetical protein Q75_16870 [Bacillus coahuilensis p1.1.43]